MTSQDLEGKNEVEILPLLFLTQSIATGGKAVSSCREEGRFGDGSIGRLSLVFTFLMN